MIIETRVTHKIKLRTGAIERAEVIQEGLGLNWGAWIFSPYGSKFLGTRTNLMDALEIAVSELEDRARDN